MLKTACTLCILQSLTQWQWITISKQTPIFPTNDTTPLFYTSTLKQTYFMCYNHYQTTSIYSNIVSNGSLSQQAVVNLSLLRLRHSAF